MKKMRLAALLMCLALLMSGCSAGDDAVIVAVNGETVTKAVINQQIDNEISYNQQMNSLYMAYYGVNMGLPTDRLTVAEDVINTNINQLVATQKARELGLDQLTAEETEQVNTAALAAYEDQISQIIASLYADLDETEARQKAVEYAVQYDITEENFIQNQTHNTVMDKLAEYIIKDITVSQAEVDEQLAQKTEEQKATFTEDPNLFGDALNVGDPVYYAPAGYRLVKHIVLIFSDEDQAVITEKQDALTAAAAAVGSAEEENKAALQAEMDAAQADLDAAEAAAMENLRVKAEEIHAQAIAEGADFDALMAQYSVDTTAPKNGYAIRDGYVNFSEVFQNAAMGLEKAGDVSELVETEYGFHIIQYAADVEEGPYEAEAARASLEQSLLYSAQQSHFNEVMTGYVNEAHIKTYPNRLNN